MVYFYIEICIDIIETKNKDEFKIQINKRHFSISQ